VIPEQADQEDVMKTNRITAMVLCMALLSSSFIVPANAQRLRAGTTMIVRLDTKISTDDNHSGDPWSGTVTHDVVSSRGRIVIPAGSHVSGEVTRSVQGDHNTRPSLDLAVQSVEVNGYSRPLSANTPTIVAGSKRAKKIGAIALGAAGGAVLGGAIGGKKGAVIGGLLGGGTSYGLTRHALRTMQLKEGTEIDFTIDQSVAMRD
jgi:hypothetical protein